MTFCVMCKAEPEIRINDITGDVVKIFFIDPNTYEQLCESCSKINNAIYKDRDSDKRSEMVLIKVLTLESLGK